MVLAAGIGAGIAAIFGVWLIVKNTGGRQRQPGRANHTISTILFENGKVIDSTPDMAELFENGKIVGLDYSCVRALLSGRFPDLPAEMPSEDYYARAVDDAFTTLTVMGSNGSVRIDLKTPILAAGQLHQLVNDKVELRRLRKVASDAPGPVWQSDAQGRIGWHNTAFSRLRSQLELEDSQANPFDLDLPNDAQSRQIRVGVTNNEGVYQSWFEVRSEPFDGGWMNYATNINSLVEAEMAQRNFVQTLTKTFAHLPTGLAVFDREHRLALFNPALVDLTQLPVDFLSARPNLFSFFDHMRENRMMPEPKNYANWREQLTETVSAARDDRYCETWSLPSGLTYKITGRPHPDGAVAFLIEDISAEISLTRRFRSELELTQSVIDCFEDAVAVFSQMGVLSFCNQGYQRLWDNDPDSAFADTTIIDATQLWQTACDPSPIWSELRDFVTVVRERSAWSSELTMKTGVRLLCIVEPVVAGATMVRFVPRDQIMADAATTPGLLQTDAGEVSLPHEAPKHDT